MFTAILDRFEDIELAGEPVWSTRMVIRSQPAARARPPPLSGRHARFRRPTCGVCRAARSWRWGHHWDDTVAVTDDGPEILTLP